MEKCDEHKSLVEDFKELKLVVADTRDIVVASSADIRWLKLDRQEQKQRYLYNRKHKLNWFIFFVMLTGLVLTALSLVAGVI